MENKENILTAEVDEVQAAGVSADFSNFNIYDYLPSYNNYTNRIDPGFYTNIPIENTPTSTLEDLLNWINCVIPSSDGAYRYTESLAKSFGFNFSFTDIVTGYTYIHNTSDSFYYNYDISGYQNSNTQVQTRTFSSGSSSSSYTARTFYNVGNRNGYLNGYNANTGVMNFVNADITSYSRQNDYVSFDMGNGTSFQAQSSSSENEIFQYSTDGQNISYAKIGYSDRDNSFTYEDGVHYIGSSEHTDVLNVSTYDSKQIHLDGSTGTIYENINNINASSSNGDNELYGNSGNNEIRAGSGNDKLWGAGGDDVLYGGFGENTYLYGVNEGNDVIYNSVATDKVDLYNVSLTDIVSADEVGQDLVINMAGGESLTIVGQNGASNFVLSDRSAYNYNRESHSWTKTA